MAIIEQLLDYQLIYLVHRATPCLSGIPCRQIRTTHLARPYRSECSDYLQIGSDRLRDFGYVVQLQHRSNFLFPLLDATYSIDDSTFVAYL